MRLVKGGKIVLETVKQVITGVSVGNNGGNASTISNDLALKTVASDSSPPILKNLQLRDIKNIFTTRNVTITTSFVIGTVMSMACGNKQKNCSTLQGYSYQEGDLLLM